jgi:hypothetical protein
VTVKKKLVYVSRNECSYLTNAAFDLFNFAN